MTFEDEDGTEISSAKYDYGTSADKVVKPADPTKEATAQYTYAFAGWSSAVVDVTKDATYTATYSSIVRCTITFLDADGTTELEKAKYDYGTANADIKKPTVASEKTVEVSAGEKTYYKFTGWKPALADVTGDATYTAVYTRAYTLTVYPYGSNHPEYKKTINLVPGDTISLETPTPIEQDKVFVGWMWPSDVTITNNKMPGQDVTVIGDWQDPQPINTNSN